ncbi:hypothetical protein P2G70_07170 [Mannheimia haemolytica]|nr:hypothetical protein [Mannheimia haemolytica]
MGERSFAIGSGVPQTLDQNTGEARRSIYDSNNNTLAAGKDSFSIGTKAKTNGDSAFAIGTNAHSGSFKVEASNIGELGDITVADKDKVANNAFALGTNTRALSNDTVAFSTNATAQGDGSIAFGVNTNTTGTGAIAFDNASKAWKDNAISIGWNATSHAEKVITIGTNSTVTKEGGMAIGDTAKSTGNNSIAVGYTSNVSNSNATAIGSRANVTHEGGTAIGFEAESIANYATAIAYNSTASGESSIAAGVNSTVSGIRAAAVGYNNTVSGNDTFVLGSNVTVNTVGSVILGSDSAQAKATYENTATVGKLTYSGFAGNDNVAEGDYVSVGNATNARQIKFVAPGNISSTSTDAINGSQLYATNKMLDNVTNSVVNNFGGNSQVDANGNITFTNIGETGKDTIHDAIKAAKTQVKQGSNVNVSKATVDGTDVYTVNAYNTTVSAVTTNGKNYLNVADNFNTGTNTTNYAVSLTDDAIRDFTKDNDTVTGVVDDGKDYVKVEKIPSPEDENRTYKVSLSDKAINEFTKDTSATVKAGSNRINVNGAANTTNPDIMDYTVDLSEITKTQIDNALSDFTVGADKNGQAAGITVNKDNKRFDIIGNNAIETRVDGNKINVDLSQTTKDQIAKEESVTVGDNLAVQQDKNNNTGGKNYHVTLNNTLNLGNDGSVTIGDTVINQNGLTINNGGPSVTTIGINAGNKVITNVADGQNDTDAVNLRQLKAVQTKVEKGTNVASVTANKDATGVTTYTINADGTTASADEASKDFLTVTTGEKNQDNVTDYKVGLTKKATDALAKAETAIQEFTTSVNGQTVETINKDNKDVGFVNGKGTIARNDNSNITFDVDVDDNTIKVGEDGKLTVNKEAVDTNTYVTGGTVVYADNGDATTTLNKNDGSSVTVTGIKNNFVNKAETSTDGKTATLTRNDGGTVNIYLTNMVNTAVNEATEKGFKISADKGDEDHVKLGETVKYTSTDKNIITTVTNNQIDFALNSTLAIGGKDGKSGIGLDGTNGTIGLTGPAGKDGKSATANITVKNGQPGVDGQDGETKTRIVYDGEEVATLNDGLKFGANTGDVHNAKLNTQVNVKGAEDNTEWNKFDAGQNIMTQISGNNITVALAKNVNLTEDGSVTIGGTNITNEGITINNGPKITNKEGSVSVANQDGSPTKITNVKAGDVNNTSTDAVNGSQLYTVQEIANAGWNLTINEGQNSSNVKPKETVDLNNKDGNIQITKDAHNVTFALNNELTIGGPGKNGADGKELYRC